MSDVIVTTEVPGLELLHRGKVRDVWDAGDGKLLLVATDRISAFDVVLPNGVPWKGAVLAQLSACWFETVVSKAARTHFVTARAREMPARLREPVHALGGRAMLVERAKVVPVECVVRAYLAGSVEKQYRETGTIQGVRLPKGIPLGGKLPEPIFTPTTKEAAGHDQPLTWEETEKKVGRDLAARLRDTSLRVFAEGARHASARGLLLCDTKFELGFLASGDLAVVDEVLTPDSSRFFKADEHVPGEKPYAWDKQVVRDWLNAHPTWDKRPPGPVLPEDVVQETSRRYRFVFERLAGRSIESAVEDAVR